MRPEAKITLLGATLKWIQRFDVVLVAKHTRDRVPPSDQRLRLLSTGTRSPDNVIEPQLPSIRGRTLKSAARVLSASEVADPVPIFISAAVCGNK